MWIRFPGVYRPQADTRLLRSVVEEAPFPPGARVLDLCTGSGMLAAAAARAGAREVVAMDSSRSAVVNAGLNARLRGLPVTVSRGDVFAHGRWPLFDAVLANPPYMPQSARGPGSRIPGRAWDAGPYGRDVLDRLCATVPGLLTEGGVFLMVHSGLCDTEQTLERLSRAGTKATVAARSFEPFGPIAHARAAYLEHQGLIEPGQRHEELVVIRADRIEQPALRP